MSLFAFYERASPLHRRHPLVKLIALALVALVVTPDLKPSTPWYDPGTPLVFLILVLASVAVFGRIPFIAIFKRLLPVALAGLALALLAALTFDPTDFLDATLEINLGPLAAYREGLQAGLGLAARLVTYATCAIAFIATTDPADLTASLIQQARISPRLAHALFARIRYLAMVDSERDAMRTARRLRGVEESGKRRTSLRRTAALLAAANRDARRAAIARVSKGFDPGAARTAYRQIAITPIDWSFLMAVVGLTLVLIEVLIFAGMIDGVAF